MIRYEGKCLVVEEGKKKILVIGDLHIGIEEALRDSGVFISTRLVDEMIEELDKVFEKVGKVDEIILLGDVKHYFGKISKDEWRGVLRLFDYLKEKCGKIILIKGNHDILIEPIAKKRKIEVREIYIKGEYCLVHGDKDFKEIWNKKIKYVIIGHEHPAVKLRGGVKVEKYKCFLTGRYKNKRFIIVPSFSELAVGSDPRESNIILAWELPFDKFDVKIVGEGLEVLDFGKLGKIK